CSLLYDEKIEILKATVEHVAGRIPVLTGVAEYTTTLACKFAQDAEAAGVDGLMLLPAMVYKSDPRETVYHFRAVAASMSLPIMLYNNPVSYGIDIKPETFAQLSDVDNIVAIKEASEDTRRITDLRNVCGERFTLFCGVDDVFFESYMLGAEGWVSGLVNAFPAENALIWDLCEEGKWEEAREVYRWYSPLLNLDTMPKLVQYIKLASAECGYGTEKCRAPRLKIEGEEREWVLGVIRKAIETRPASPVKA
ncbi:MAG: dihydrodipicolinate synthase family protein, partial [Planctomycetota bacterium]